MRLSLLLALVSLAVTVPLCAQGGEPGSPREYQLRILEHQRRLLLAMADSMPERLYRDQAAQGQRDFAQQIHHAASAAVFIGSTTMKGPTPQLPDTAVALNSRAGLRSFVNAAFDYTATLLRDQSAASRGEMVELFGNRMPGWQVWDEIHAHTVWTAGQAVANFRKHGMAPPAYTLF